MELYHNRFDKTYILWRKFLRLTRNCRMWIRSNYQQVCHKEVGQNQKHFLNLGQWWIIYKSICDKYMVSWKYGFKCNIYQWHVNNFLLLSLSRKTAQSSFSRSRLQLIKFPKPKSNLYKKTSPVRFIPGTVMPYI